MKALCKQYLEFWKVPAALGNWMGSTQQNQLL